MAHIVHICPRYAPARGGVEVFFAKLSEALAARGDQVSVWTTDASTVRAFTVASSPRLAAGPVSMGGVTVERFPVRYVPLQRWTRTAAHYLPFGRRWKCDTLRWTPWVPSLTKAAEQYRGPVDLVHVAGLPYSSILFAGARLAESSHARLVISPFTHLPPPGPAGRVMRQAYLSRLNVELLERADCVFAQTALEARALTDAGLRADRQSIVGAGLSPEDVSGGDRRRARDAWGIKGDVPVVGHLGNKSRDKGTLDLIAAAEQLWSRGVQFTLVLAGPAMAHFEADLARRRVPIALVNLPELSDAERRDFYAGIDVFALPSYVESFGLSALEAAWCGSPVVAYDHGGPSELFEDGRTAALPPVGDIAALARALETLVTTPGERERLATAAKSVAAEHSWPRALSRAFGVYDELLSGGNGRRS